MKKVCVIGLGYIGLPTAIIAAKHNFSVIGFDIDQKKVERINNGDPVIQEPEIHENLCHAFATGNLKASAIIESADVFIIAVPTPITHEKTADLSYVWDATNSIATVLKKGNTVIVESTISVGTTEKIATILAKKSGLEAGKDFYVAHCPERVLPGKIFYELTHNSRIIGGINQASAESAKQFYEQFVNGQLHCTDDKTAELIKLTENSYRDVSIAFANQVAAMAYELQLDPFSVIELANKHPRVTILQPSCGVGGHCIALDPWFLIETFPAQTELLKVARIVNDKKPLQVLDMIHKETDSWQKKHNRIPTVLVLGLTYKANVDDLRESPALFIAEKLYQENKVTTLICEPNVCQKTVESLFQKNVCSLQQGIDKADIIIALVAHQQFAHLKKYTCDTKKILDFCGLLYESPHKMIYSITKRDTVITENICTQNQKHQTKIITESSG